MVYPMPRKKEKSMTWGIFRCLPDALNAIRLQLDGLQQMAAVAVEQFYEQRQLQP